MESGEADTFDSNRAKVASTTLGRGSQEVFLQTNHMTKNLSATNVYGINLIN